MLDGRMYYDDCAVQSAGNDLQNVVADDWRCLKLEHSSLPDTVALCCGVIGGLLHQACTRLGLPHRASASRHVESATVLGRTCACRSRDIVSKQLSTSTIRKQSRLEACSSIHVSTCLIYFLNCLIFVQQFVTSQARYNIVPLHRVREKRGQ